ncbi:hypothetical protein KDH83_30475, partial [Achromobacter sp. Marseille-Q0513]|uniref:hypothetical protein n=1 Tax=Achromobacter sp. Marseille-Q0513 TaxID=2829161 RepID=UPI001B910E73
GGIVGNFATVASGAGIAVGSSLLAQQYSLAAQTGIYDMAAKRVMCVATVLEVSTVVSPDLQEVVVAARSASTRILMDLRRSLGELKVPEVNAASVAALYAARIAQSVKFENNKPFFASTIDATQSVKLDISSCAETGQPVSTTVAPLVVQ